MPVRNTAKLGAVLRNCPIVLMDTEQKVSSKHVKIPGQWRVRARTRDQRTTTSWFDLTPGPHHRSHRRGARGAFRPDGLRLASDSAGAAVAGGRLTRDAVRQTSGQHEPSAVARLGIPPHRLHHQLPRDCQFRTMLEPLARPEVCGWFSARRCRWARLSEDGLNGRLRLSVPGLGGLARKLRLPSAFGSLRPGSQTRSGPLLDKRVPGRTEGVAAAAEHSLPLAGQPVRSDVAGGSLSKASSSPG